MISLNSAESPSPSIILQQPSSIIKSKPYMLNREKQIRITTANMDSNTQIKVENFKETRINLHNTSFLLENINSYALLKFISTVRSVSALSHPFPTCDEHVNYHTTPLQLVYKEFRDESRERALDSVCVQVKQKKPNSSSYVKLATLKIHNTTKSIQVQGKPSNVTKCISEVIDPLTKLMSEFNKVKITEYTCTVCVCYPALKYRDSSPIPQLQSSPNVLFQALDNHPLIDICNSPILPPRNHEVVKNLALVKYTDLNKFNMDQLTAPSDVVCEPACARTDLIQDEKTTEPLDSLFHTPTGDIVSTRASITDIEVNKQSVDQQSATPGVVPSTNPNTNKNNLDSSLSLNILPSSSIPDDSVNNHITDTDFELNSSSVVQETAISSLVLSRDIIQNENAPESLDSQMSNSVPASVSEIDLNKLHVDQSTATPDLKNTTAKSTNTESNMNEETHDSSKSISGLLHNVINRMNLLEKQLCDMNIEKNSLQNSFDIHVNKSEEKIKSLEKLVADLSRQLSKASTTIKRKNHPPNTKQLSPSHSSPASVVSETVTDRISSTPHVHDPAPPVSPPANDPNSCLPLNQVSSKESGSKLPDVSVMTASTASQTATSQTPHSGSTASVSLSTNAVSNGLRAVDNVLVGDSNLHRIRNFILNRAPNANIAATSGASFAEMKDKLEKISSSRVVVIQGGTSNVCQSDNIDRIRDDLIDLVQVAKEKSDNIILVPPPPTRDEISMLASLMSEVANKENVKFTPIAKWFQLPCYSNDHLIARDGLHCTRKGAGLYGLAVVDSLIKYRTGLVTCDYLASCIICHKSGHGMSSCKDRMFRRQQPSHPHQSSSYYHSHPNTEPPHPSRIGQYMDDMFNSAYDSHYYYGPSRNYDDYYQGYH